MKVKSNMRVSHFAKCETGERSFYDIDVDAVALADMPCIGKQEAS